MAQYGYQQNVEMVPYMNQGPPMMGNMQHQEIENQALAAHDAEQIKSEKSAHKMSMTWKIIFGICGVIFVLGIIMVILGVGKTLGKSLGKSGSTFFNDLVYVGLAAIIGPMLLAAGKWAVNKYKQSKKDKKNEPPKDQPPKDEPPKDEPPKNEPPKDEPPKNEPPREGPVVDSAKAEKPNISGIYVVPAIEDIQFSIEN